VCVCEYVGVSECVLCVCVCVHVCVCVCVCGWVSQTWVGSVDVRERGIGSVWTFVCVCLRVDRQCEVLVSDE
jgi:hypothetical protein